MARCNDSRPDLPERSTLTVEEALAVTEFLARCVERGAEFSADTRVLLRRDNSGLWLELGDCC